MTDTAAPAIPSGVTGAAVRPGSAARRTRSALGWLVLVAALWVVWPVQLGGHFGVTVVSGHSMNPTYHTNDLLLTWKGGDYKPGEVLVYKVPGHDVGSGLRVVHRLRAVDADGQYTLRGDNNASIDVWHPRSSDVQGKVVRLVPQGGLVLRWLMSPIALALLCGVLIGALVAAPKKPKTPVRRPARERAKHAADVATAGPGRRTLAARLGAVAAIVLVALGVASATSLGGVKAATLFASNGPTSVPVPSGSVTYAQTIQNDNPLDYCATVTVTNSTNAAVTWQVAVDMTTAPFNATTISSSYGVTQVSFTGGVWTVRGVSYNDTLAAGASVTWGYCGTRSVPALVDATTSASVTSDSGGQYCTTVTVSTTSATWIRWRSTITHSTPGLTSNRYWLTAQPTGNWSSTSISFSPGAAGWVVRGGGSNDYVKAGSPTTWGYCAPTH